MSEHSELPFPEYDHVTLGHLPARISSLDLDALVRLADYERAHGNRLPVLQVLNRRIEAVRAGAEPSGALPGSLPETASAPGAGSAVSPTTSGPPINPPSHGTPSNPAQPR